MNIRRTTRIFVVYILRKIGGISMSDFERRSRIYNDELIREQARKDARSSQNDDGTGFLVALVIGIIVGIIWFVKHHAILSGIILAALILATTLTVVTRYNLRIEREQELERLMIKKAEDAAKEAALKQQRQEASVREAERLRNERIAKETKYKETRNSFCEKISQAQKKILVVDDQNGFRVLLKEVFENEGFLSFVAKNGKLGLEVFKENAPDIILLDIKMPEMNGIEMLRKIREVNQSVPVIMMTAYGELDEIRECAQLGAPIHFTKPFDIDELRDTVLFSIYPDAKQVLERFA